MQQLMSVEPDAVTVDAHEYRWQYGQSSSAWIRLSSFSSTHVLYASESLDDEARDGPAMPALWLVRRPRPSRASEPLDEGRDVASVGLDKDKETQLQPSPFTICISWYLYTEVENPPSRLRIRYG